MALSTELMAYDSSYRFSRARDLFIMGRYVEAAEEMESLISLRPENSDYHHMRSLAMMMLGKNNDAIQEIQDSLKCDPYSPHYLLTLFELYLRENRKEDCNEIISRLVQGGFLNKDELCRIAREDVFSNIRSVSEEVHEIIC